MSYFDHVGCHTCGAQFDPNRVEAVNGRMACPYCKAELGVTDLFGIKASFLEDDQPNRTLEDLVPGEGGHFDDPWGQPAGGHDMNMGAWAPDMGDAGGIHTGREDGGYTHQKQPQAPRQAAPAPRPAQPPPRQQASVAGVRFGDDPAPSRPAPVPEARRLGTSDGPMRSATPAPRASAPPAPEPPRGGGGGSALDALKAMKGKKK